MLASHNRYRYSGIDTRPKYRWPGGRSLALYVAVNASWTVNGGAPSTESCADACIGQVRLRIWEQYDGGDAYTQDEWLVDCAAGTITTQPILKADTYRVGLYGVTIEQEQDLGGLECSNRSVQAAAIEEVSVEPGGTISVSLDLSPEEE